jgi:hypothetical protein
MDVSVASYYISIVKRKKNKGSQMGHTKKKKKKKKVQLCIEWKNDKQDMITTFLFLPI